MHVSRKRQKTALKAFVTSQFGYCTLFWMIHSRDFKNKINSLHERALRITHGDKFSSFQDLLKKITQFLSMIGIYEL